jgi:hypothetical protein
MRGLVGPAKLAGCICWATREQGVHHELIRALPVAILVGILPGYFWAKCLASSAEYMERIAYSMALSVTLVPAAALLQAGLLDSEITFLIAAVSVSLVFATGFVAYLWFGTASDAGGGPLAPPPAPPNIYALVPLPAAFGLVLGARVGLAPGDRYMSYVALLFAVAGAVYLSGSRRDGRKPTQGEPPSEALADRWPGVLRTLVLAAVLALTVVRGYLGPIKHDWPYLRGGDQFSHAVMTNLMMTEGEIDAYLIYPPGFHTLTALISRLSGLEPLEIFPLLAPALIVLPALSCYALACRLWGWGYGVIGAFFTGVLLVGPYASFADARYPNVVSANFLIVMGVAALAGLYTSPRARPGVLFALLGSSVVLYHQVASFYLALLLALIAILFLPYLLLRRSRRGLALLLSLVLLGSISVVYAWDTYDLPRLVGGLLGGSDAGAGSTTVTNAIGSQEPSSLEHLVEMSSQPVLWLGLMGALLTSGYLLRGRVAVPQTLACLTLLMWASLLFVGSRTSLSGFPQRFERDLGIPLAVLAALAFVSILRSSRLRTTASSPPARLVAILAAALAIVVVGLQAAENLSDADAPSSSVISAEVAAAGEWLGDHGTGGNIVVTPYLNDHIPGSAMLAMGGYTGLRSYTLERVRSPRALPPSGKEPLRAAQWVMHHPLGERTGAILERYHIRYIVLFKRYPGVPWRTFESRPGLYEKAFENGAVIILRPT